MTAITAVTAQNTTGVKSIVPIKPKEISNQIEFTANDIRPDAIKIGMLHSKQVILTVIKSLRKINVKKIVLDPVMVAKGGTELINKAAIIDVNFVRKVPTDLVVVKLSCETPKPKAPPSDLCRRIAIINMIASMTLTKISKLSILFIYSNFLLYQ